jgi:cob(I)alamin adenosyltransferase
MGDNRLTRITTRSGDDGNTGLADGTRLAKTHPCIVAIGEVDELNTQIGALCVAPGLDALMLARLREVQHDLFDLGGELSLPGVQVLRREALTALDIDIAEWNTALPPLKEFVLPGSNEANARAHIARTVCRRAERALWELAATPGNTLDAALPRYLNRLSDWLFVLSRVLALRGGGSEVIWRRG